MPFGKVEAFEEIAKVPDLLRGEASDELAPVQDFLVRFGYLESEKYSAGELDDQTATALATYQERHSLSPTGEIDQETRDSMTTARCALPDLSRGVEFSAQCSWDRTALTFAFGPGTADTAGNSEFAAVRRAFATWAAASPLTFSEVTANDNPDILIDWRDANDPDLSMVGGTLAHADFPPPCGVVTNTLPKPVHFDDSEHTWSDGAVANAFDIETVALHEIGHILGLGHTTVNGAVMFPTVKSNFTLRVLQNDDRDGIRSLYAPLPTGPSATGNDMQPGEVLLPGASITSANGRYRFVYQSDGNLVLYEGGNPLWASNTWGQPVGVCIMQTDGNLVIYAPTGANPIWSSDTWGNPGSHLVLQDDGNVVIYRPNGAPIWSTNTWLPTGPAATGTDMQPGEVLDPGGTIHSANGRYTFVYQGDGNLVLYEGGNPLWASNTWGQPVGVCIMQGDGNLVIYARGGAPIWSSDTWGNPGSHLVLQDDGNVVIYRPDGAPIWSTNTWLPMGPAATGNDMQPGQVLDPGGTITSASGRYRFVYQGDGNLVLYEGGNPLWASNTDGQPVGVCIMQGDGNLVIYARGGVVIWSSNTWGNPGSHLVLQDDGNVVIYRPDGAPIWSTNTWLPTGPAATGNDMQPGQVLDPGGTITSTNGQYSFVYQGDGNLVLYEGGNPLWASNTWGQPVGVCIMQGDGNLVIYARGGVPIWSSNTWGNPGSHLVLQDDRNVVIYRPDGTPIWATDTWI